MRLLTVEFHASLASLSGLLRSLLWTGVALVCFLHVAPGAKEGPQRTRLTFASAFYIDVAISNASTPDIYYLE